MEESRWAQRRISTSNRTLKLPRALLLFSLVDLTWEIIKANLSKGVREDWPWRFVVLDATTCAAVLALLTGIIVTRAQLSQTMQPVLSWSGFRGRSHELTDSLRTISVVNAGGGRAVVRSVAYQIQVSGAHASHVAIPSGWMNWRDTIDSFAALGLERGQDFFLLHLGRGAAIPMATSGREGMELAALTPKALDRLVLIHIKIQVADVLGDVHERILQCVRLVPQPR